MFNVSVPTTGFAINIFWPNAILGHYSTGCGVLSEWQSWSRCSVSCGTGLKFRTRTCIKNHETDKDCYGERSQDELCSLAPCKGTHINM